MGEARIKKLFRLKNGLDVPLPRILCQLCDKDITFSLCLCVEDAIEYGIYPNPMPPKLKEFLDAIEVKK